jgi:hypothetical protein
MANDRLLKCVYWLNDAKTRGLDPGTVIDDAQLATNPHQQHSALVKQYLLRNLDIADKLGCLTPEGTEKMRRGASPTVTRGPYRGEIAEVDHIIPISVAPEIGNEIANLELMPRTLNRRKGATIGSRHMQHARNLSEVGVLPQEVLSRLRRVER